MKFATLIVLFVKLSLKAVQLHLVFPVNILRLHQKSEKKLANITLDKFSHIYQAVENMETKLNKKRFLNYRKTFSSCTDYIFFVQFVFQQLNLNNQINIAMKKTAEAAPFLQNTSVRLLLKQWEMTHFTKDRTLIASDKIYSHSFRQKLCFRECH